MSELDRISFFLDEQFLEVEHLSLLLLLSKCESLKRNEFTFFTIELFEFSDVDDKQGDKNNDEFSKGFDFFNEGSFFRSSSSLIPTVHEIDIGVKGRQTSMKEELCFVFLYFRIPINLLATNSIDFSVDKNFNDFLIDKSSFKSLV